MTHDEILPELDAGLVVGIYIDWRATGKRDNTMAAVLEILAMLGIVDPAAANDGQTTRLNVLPEPLEDGLWVLIREAQK
jgi:hypothetical protein